MFANNGVAPGEQMALAALRHLPAIRRRAQAILAPNLERVARYLQAEPRLVAHPPAGGSVFWAVLPSGLDGDRLARRLRRRFGTQVVPGRFFERRDALRVSFGMPAPDLASGLENLSLCLDELAGRPKSGRFQSRA